MDTEITNVETNVKYNTVCTVSHINMAVKFMISMEGIYAVKLN